MLPVLLPMENKLIIGGIKMSNLASRESYVESEYKKWEDKFEIPFEQEFNVKALLSLQYQFLNLPDEHIKTKADIVATISRINKDLNLHRKVKLNDNEKRALLFVTSNKGQREILEDLLSSSIPNEEIENVLSTNGHMRMKTDKYIINIYENGNSQMLRGLRADEVFKIEDGRKLIK
jgi:hypothetical protein